jgi:hypothetical protein
MLMMMITITPHKKGTTGMIVIIMVVVALPFPWTFGVNRENSASISIDARIIFFMPACVRPD